MRIEKKDLRYCIHELERARAQIEGFIRRDDSAESRKALRVEAKRIDGRLKRFARLNLDTEGEGIATVKQKPMRKLQSEVRKLWLHVYDLAAVENQETLRKEMDRFAYELSSLYMWIEQYMYREITRQVIEGDPELDELTSEELAEDEATATEEGWNNHANRPRVEGRAPWWDTEDE